MTTTLIDAVERTTPPLTDHHAARERYFEDWIIRTSEDVAVTQVVIAPAPACTWAYRVDWAPHVRLFEVWDGWEKGPGLAAAGYDPALPSAWLLESGPLACGAEADAHRLLCRVAGLTAFGSQIAVAVDGVAAPRGLFRSYGFDVTPGTAGVVTGWRR